jgi:hypothetical protein
VLILVVYPTTIPAGMLLPESTIHSQAFSVLAAFVAINTVIYGSLAVVKMLPKIYPTSPLGGRGRRSQDRSIYGGVDQSPQTAPTTPGKSPAQITLPEQGARTP